AIPQPEAQLSSLSRVVQQPRRRTLVLLRQTPRASFYGDQDLSPPSPPATPLQSSPQRFSEHRSLHRSHSFEGVSRPAQQRPRTQALLPCKRPPTSYSLVTSNPWPDHTPAFDVVPPTSRETMLSDPPA